MNRWRDRNRGWVEQGELFQLERQTSREAGNGRERKEKYHLQILVRGSTRRCGRAGVWYRVGGCRVARRRGVSDGRKNESPRECTTSCRWCCGSVEKSKTHLAWQGKRNQATWGLCSEVVAAARKTLMRRQLPLRMRKMLLLP